MAPRLLARRTPRLNPLVGRGDSLTNGTGATSSDTKWMTLLARSYWNTRDATWNSGVGGETSTQIKDRFLNSTGGYRNATTLIWAGRNNYTDGATVQADIAAMVGYLTTDRFLVLSVMNGDYASEYKDGSGWVQITTLNANLRATYGSRFLDIRTPMVAAYNPSLPQDVIDFGRDIPPTSLRYDQVHHNDAGQAFVFSIVGPALLARGW